MCPPSTAVRQRAMASSTFDVRPANPLAVALEESCSRRAYQTRGLAVAWR
jgi:hypothetical protein